MKLKYALWATAVWTFLGCGGAGAGLWYITTHRVRGASSQERAKRFGLGAGTLMGFGYAGIWLPYAWQLGKRRREMKREEEQPVRKKKRPRQHRDEDDA